MVDKKFTDEEIKKALECCIKTPFCSEKTDCPYKGIDDCVKRHTLDSIELINRLEAERDRLKRHGGKKCGTCIYAKPTTFGRSKVYVECTNAEHLKKYCSYHESAKNRLRTTPACKLYKDKPENLEAVENGSAAEREDNRNETS